MPSQADRVRSLFDSAAPAYAREREQEYSFQSQKKIVLEMLQGSSGRALDRQLARVGLHKLESRACNFIFFT